MFNFEIGQFVYYLINNKVYSAPILSRAIVENNPDNVRHAHTDEQNRIYERFGPSVTKYSTIHGVFEQVFASKEDLLKSL